MRKILIGVIVLTSLLGCGAEPGREGGRCLEEGDTAICESVEWDEMRERRVAGGDPDDYYVLSYPVAP